MRIVLDTNVLISALIARGVCTDLLEHCVLHHTMISSPHILDELREHLIGKFKYTDEETQEAVSLLEDHMRIVTPVDLDKPACRDPDDDTVLATAVAGKADCIVTGDKDPLVLRQYETIEIIRPRDFADFEIR